MRFKDILILLLLAMGCLSPGCERTEPQSHKYTLSYSSGMRSPIQILEIQQTPEFVFFKSIHECEISQTDLSTWQVSINLPSEATTGLPWGSEIKTCFLVVNDDKSIIIVGNSVGWDFHKVSVDQ